MQALKQERARRERDGAPTSIMADTEQALVGFFVEGCRFEMQAGHMERGIACIQAALEYTCFPPSIPVGMLSLVALPCSALPCPAPPCPALPCPALPCPDLPCPALPSPAVLLLLACSHGFLSHV